MTSDDWKAIGVQTYGLTSDLFIPIAAKSIEAIETYVGKIQEYVVSRKRPINAVVVVANIPKRNPNVPLWDENEADHYYKRLHPSKQFWVHVDYTNYRKAWTRSNFGKLTGEVFLDHIRNREAERLIGYRHPFLRLCPVSRKTNTNSGLNNGTEGMEKKTIRNFGKRPEDIRRKVEQGLAAPVILADPIDITKMLNIPPGLYELQGVAAMLLKYYAII